MKTFKALLKMEYILSKRQLSNLIMGIGMPIGFFIFFSGFLGGGSKAEEAMYVRNYMLTMAAFSSLSFAFFTFPFSLKDDKTNHRFLAIVHSPVPLWQYYLAKLCRILVYYCVAILAVFVTGHLLRHVTMTGGQWLQSFTLLLVGALCFLPFGLLISYLKSAELMSMVGNVSYMLLAVVGGMWMPVSLFPTWLQSLSKWTPTYHLATILTSQFTDKFALQSFLILAFYDIMVLFICLVLEKKREYGR